MEWRDNLKRSFAAIFPLPSDDLGALVGIFRERRLAKGEVLVRAGEESRETCLILRGGLRHYYLDERGAERITDFCVEGQFAGGLEALSGRSASSAEWIAAFEESELAAAGVGELLALAAERPALQGAMNAVLLGYYEWTQSVKRALGSPDPALRYENFLALMPALAARLPQYHIASFLGMTPETLSRVRSRRG